MTKTRSRADPRRHRLSRTERIILERLARAKDYVDTGTLIFTVWHAENRDEPLGADRVLQVHIYHLRRKLAFTGLEIVSQAYFGYRLQVKPT